MKRTNADIAEIVQRHGLDGHGSPNGWRLRDMIEAAK